MAEQKAQFAYETSSFFFFFLQKLGVGVCKGNMRNVECSSHQKILRDRKEGQNSLGS